MYSSNSSEREIHEAIQAGVNALSHLEAAADKLGSARNWGIYDLFGGGGLASMIKHAKLNDASRCIEDAKHYLVIFQRELRDVQVPMEFGVEIGNFLTFADFFFDGIVADYLVQSKINDARSQVNDAIGQVQTILYRLRALLPGNER